MPHDDEALERRAVREGWIQAPWEMPPDEHKRAIMVRMSNAATNPDSSIRVAMAAANTLLKAQQQNLEVAKMNMPKQPLVAIQNNVASNDQDRPIDRKRELDIQMAELRVQQMKGQLVPAETVSLILETVSNALRKRFDALANISIDAHNLVVEAIEDAERTLRDMFEQHVDASSN